MNEPQMLCINPEISVGTVSQIPAHNAWKQPTLSKLEKIFDRRKCTNSIRMIMLEEEKEKERTRKEKELKDRLLEEQRKIDCNSKSLHRGGKHSTSRYSSRNKVRNQNQQQGLSASPGKESGKNDEPKTKSSPNHIQASKQKEINHKRPQGNAAFKKKTKINDNYFSQSRKTPNYLYGKGKPMKNKRRRPRDENLNNSLARLSFTSAPLPCTSDSVYPCHYLSCSKSPFTTMTCEEYSSATALFTSAEEQVYIDKKERARYVSLDCEMVGIGPGGEKSALARVCIVNWDYQILLDTFVKVDEPVTDYRTFVSGVRHEDLKSKNAMDFEKCRKAVRKIISGKVLIGHALQNDLYVLNISHPWFDIRDTAMYTPFMAASLVGGISLAALPNSQNNVCPNLTESDCSSTASSMSSSSSTDPSAVSINPSILRTTQSVSAPVMQLRPRKLRELAREYLGISIQEIGSEHSPLEDANAALGLYKLNRVQWESVLLHTSKRSIEHTKS